MSCCCCKHHCCCTSRQPEEQFPYDKKFYIRPVGENIPPSLRERKNVTFQGDSDPIDIKKKVTWTYNKKETPGCLYCSTAILTGVEFFVGPRSIKVIDFRVKHYIDPGGCFTINTLTIDLADLLS
jgi:hypothetical protein